MKDRHWTSMYWRHLAEDGDKQWALVGLQV